MLTPTNPDNQFTLLDGVALIIGASIASVHLRDLVLRPLGVAGWVMLWVTFIGVSLTAAGPFVFAFRRCARRLPGYPRAGDWLWAFLGLPWILTAALHPVVVPTAMGDSLPVHNATYVAALLASMSVACLFSCVVVWKTWVIAPPRVADEGEPRHWTDRVGLILAIAWPVQCGFTLALSS